MGKTITLGAVGDVAFYNALAKSAQENGLSWPFEKVRPILAEADLLFGNMESVLLPGDYPEDQIDGRGLVSRFNGLAALKEAGFDFLCLANNHVLDGGSVSMFHTQREIERLGMASGGVGNTQAEARQMRVLQAKGISVGFLCYCEDTNYSLGTRGPGHAYYTREAVIEDVKQHRGEVDVLVVSIHADLEFMETPSVPRRANFRDIAQAGATVVLGHHPHVPQGIERIGNSLVAYSLGNFYFASHSMAYMRESGPHTASSFILLMEVGNEGVVSFRRVPCRIFEPPNERPIPLEGEAGRAMLQYLEELDRKVLDDELVKRTWRERSLQMARTYLERLKGMSLEQAMGDTLFRMLLVQENGNWAREAFEVARENWEKLANSSDPLHRPHYVLIKQNEERKKAEDGKQ